MDGSGEGGGLKFAVADGFWARLSIDVIESVAVELGLGRIWGDACAVIDGKGSRVVGGPLLSGGLGGSARSAVVAIGWRIFCHHLVISCLWAYWCWLYVD